MNEIIPVPVTFNPYKHHFRFLTRKVAHWKTQDWQTVKSEISFMGNNLLDFYLGTLPVATICRECIRFFEEKRIPAKSQFLEWLNHMEFKKIQLSDKSVWIVKKGVDPERYIHIHPAKNSLHSVRVRATTLKTVVALQVLAGPKHITLEEVNRIRIEYLNLSPVKSIHPEKGIYKLWKYFNSQ